MVSFDFKGTDFSLISTTTNNKLVTFVEDGIRFTLSSNDIGTSVYYDTSNSELFLTMSGGTGPVTLQIQSPTASVFTGNLVLGFAVNGNDSSATGILFGTPSGTAQQIYNVSQDDATLTTSATLTGVNSSGIVFTFLFGSGGNFVFNSLTANISCFASGTGISTPTGRIPVQELQAGDNVLTEDGRTVAVKWVGQQFIDTRLTHPARVNPICILQGAFAENVPDRDLYVSLDHAVVVDGLLINAGALVNGRTIHQVKNMPLEGFTYYHVETEAHEVLMAENCPAESFIDYSEVFQFDNSKDRLERKISEMNLKRVSTARMVPETTRARILARAERMDKALPLTG